MNLLVVQTAFLGDAVLTTPLLRALKETHPGCRLTLLTTPANKALLEGILEVDEFLVDRKREEGVLRASLGLLGPLREGNFDLAVAAHRSARTALLLALARIPRRVGFDANPLSRLYHQRVHDDPTMQAGRRYLLLMKAFGRDPTSFDHQTFLRVNPGCYAHVDAVLRERGCDGSRPIAVLAHGSVWKTKKWTEEGYAALAGFLREERGFDVVLVGDASERERAAHICALSRTEPVDLTGRTTLAEVVALIARCDFVVSNDSAPLHIASAFRKPQVAVFCSTAPEAGFVPTHERWAAAELEGLYCRPCGVHGAKRCPEGHLRCVKELTPEVVFEAVERVLSLPSGSADTAGEGGAASS
jgi:heptosyltransferase-2